MAALAVITLGLLVAAGWKSLADIDATVSAKLVVPARGTEVEILRILTAAGGAMAQVLVLAPLTGWLAWRRKWRLVALVVAGGAVVGVLTALLKSIVERPRPSYDTAVAISGFSYPSGHASSAAALGTILVVVFWPLVSAAWRWVLLVVAVIGVVVVGYSRVALGVHFMSDVIAGWCVGVAWVLGLAMVLRVWPGQPGALESAR